MLIIPLFCQLEREHAKALNSIHWKINDEVEVIKLCEKVIGWDENFQLKLRRRIESKMDYRPQGDNV